MLSTTIPFSGFYSSLHDRSCEDALSQAFSDDSGTPNAGLLDRAFDLVSWRDVQKEYAKKYTEAFAQEFKIALQFETMVSPREYNFTTDRIFAHIDSSEAARLLALVDPETLADTVRQTFTSRSGFSSFYNPDVTTWGEISTWDHNQIGTLLQAYAGEESNSSDGFDQWAEWSLCEDFNGNGCLDNWIFGSNPEKLNRLHRVGRYLRDRAER